MSADSGTRTPSSTHATLLSKLNDRTARIGVLGLGYVGLPLVLRFAEVGYKVTGFDVDQTKVDKLNKCETYIERITSDIIRRALDRGFTATGDLSQCADMDLRDRLDARIASALPPLDCVRRNQAGWVN